MDHILPAEPAPAPADFGHEAVAVLKNLRRTTAAVLGTWSDVRRAIDVADRLGLDRNLAWKIWQVGQGQGACPSPAHIPGRQGFTRFIDAAGHAGVRSEALDDAQAAFEKFVLLTRVHAGDRASADIMLGALTDEGRQRMETTLRRDGFRANAHFLGVQARTLYQLDVIVPVPDFMPEVTRVRGHFGLRRNRLNVPWIIARSTLVHEEGPSSGLLRTPIGESADGSPGSCPLLVERFSSQPPPPIRRRVIAGATVEDELEPGPVGEGGAVDAVTAERFTRMPRRDVTSDAVTMVVSSPCERLCYDVILPEAFCAGGVKMRVHSTVQSELPYLRGDEFAVIPVTEHFENLGDPFTAPGCSDVPSHERILAWALSRAGAQGTPMRLWRARMKFPPMPACVAATYQVG